MSKTDILHKNKTIFCLRREIQTLYALLKKPIFVKFYKFTHLLSFIRADEKHISGLRCADTAD